jgi:hypothetical protein
MAGIIEQQILQEVRFLPGQSFVGLMCRQLLLDGLEQGLVDDRRLLPRQDLIAVPDFANEKLVAEEVGEGPSSERDASGDGSPAIKKALQASAVESLRAIAAGLND